MQFAGNTGQGLSGSDMEAVTQSNPESTEWDPLVSMQCAMFL